MPDVNFVPVPPPGSASLTVLSNRTGLALAGRPTSWGATDAGGSVVNPSVPNQMQTVTVTDVAGTVNTFQLDYTVLRSHEVSVFGGNNLGAGPWWLYIRTTRPPTVTEQQLGQQVQGLGGVYVMATDGTDTFSGVTTASGTIEFQWGGGGHLSPGDVSFEVRGAKTNYVPAATAANFTSALLLPLVPPPVPLELQPLPIQPTGPILLELSLLRAADPIPGLGPAWRAANATISGGGADIDVSFNARGVASTSLAAGWYDISVSSPFYTVDTEFHAGPLEVEMVAPGPVAFAITVEVTDGVVGPTPGNYKYQFLPVGRAPDDSDPPVYKYKILDSTSWLTGDGIPTQTVVIAGGAGLFTFEELQLQAGGEFCVTVAGTYHMSVSANSFGKAYEAIEMDLIADGDLSDSNIINVNFLTMDESRDRVDLTDTLNFGGDFHGHTIGPGTSVEAYSDSDCTTLIGGPSTPDSSGTLTLMVTNPCWVKGFDAGGVWGPERVDF